MSDYESGYARALKAAGFTVKDFAEFGSYQGDWFAFVEFDGKLGFIQDSYGSCGGCDEFEGSHADKTPASLKAFGEHYIDQILSYDQALQYAKKHSEWDLEAKTMVEWVESHQYVMDFEDIINKDS